MSLLRVTVMEELLETVFPAASFNNLPASEFAVYAAATEVLFCTKSVRVSVILRPLLATDTALTVLDALFTVTAKSPASGVPLTASPKLRTRDFVPAVTVPPVKAGRTPSITSAELLESEPVPPTVGKVRVAALEALSRIVPPFKASALAPP